MKTYFISNGTMVKIGRSVDPARRLREAQTHSPVPLSLILVVDGDHEREFHERFAAHRGNGEWFSLEGVKLFYLWLATQTERNDWIGDFAEDAVDDKHFPRHLDGYYEIIEEVTRHNRFICREARLAYALAYREYLRILRRAGITMGFIGRYRKMREDYGKSVNRLQTSESVTGNR